MTHLLLRGLSALFQHLPEPAALALGRGLGRLAFPVARRRRAIALAGLRRAFGDACDHRALQDLCRANFVHYGTILAEVLRLPALSNDALRDRFTLTGREHLDRAAAQGRGVIVITAHLGNWEWLVAYQAVLGLDMAVITRHAHDRGVDRFWQGMRARRGVRCVDSYRSLKDVLRHLEGGGTVGMTIDQHEGGTTGARVPFFGDEAGTVKAPALLAARLGCPVLLFLSWRDADGRHHASFSEPIALEPGSDLVEVVARTTRRYNALLEAAIREHPEQWSWVHRRWKPA